MSMKLRAGIPLAVLALIWMMPVPDGLTVHGMRFFGIFVAVILALILEPLPNSAVGLIGITSAGVLQLVPLAERTNAAIAAAAKAGTAVVLPSYGSAHIGPSLAWSLSGFVDAVVWLIFVAFMFALGFQKTGLGRRIALTLMQKLGAKPLGLGYAAACSDLVIAPFTPSNTARSCGVVYPVVSSIPPMYGSLPDNEPRKIGAYLMWVCFATTCVTSSWFLTGVAPSLLALSLMRDGMAAAGLVAGTTPPTDLISWAQWLWCLMPIGLILFIFVPWFTFKIYPPTMKESPETPAWAKEELHKLGPISPKEIAMLVLMLLALTLWIGGTKYVNATQTALIVLCLMLILNVVSWDDILSNKPAWNVLVWFATLVAMASGLARVGFLRWLGDFFQTYLAGSSEAVILFALMFLFYLLHYFFASLTAHTTALFPLFMTIGIAAGVDPRLLGMMMAGSLGIMGILTPYGTGPAPLYYNTGYIDRKTFWAFGSLFGWIFFLVYAIFAITWFPRILGPWGA